MLGAEHRAATAGTRTRALPAVPIVAGPSARRHGEFADTR
jgi:hypothetical protein